MASFLMAFGRAAGDVEGAERAIGLHLRARQAASTISPSSISASKTSASPSDSLSTASASTAASESSITTSASSTSITSASESLPSDVLASTAPDGNVILSLITPPPYTATSFTAYSAPGKNTTTQPPPPNTFAVTSTSSSSSTTSTSTTSIHVAPGAWATAPGVPSNILTACQIDGKNTTFGLFCSPTALQTLWVGYTYAMTWNGNLLPLNATSTVQLQYNNTALGNATVTQSVPSFFGYQNITLDEAWLQGADGNSSWSGQNITLILISQPAGDAEAIIKTGPMISLARNPKTLPPVLIPKIPSKYGLEIGLPIGLVAAIVILLSVCCAVKKNNGRFRDLKGSLTKDYMSKRSRRGGGGRRGGGKGGDWDADDMELSPTAEHGGYTDEPVKGGQNAFRDEIRRQREEDDQSIKRTFSSY